ncbi:MAG: AAA family ATPase [Pseudomonadota bacterium]
MATGLLSGTFMPPHAGHQLLVDFARAYVDELVILCFAYDDDPIAPSARAAWLRELFPGADVRLVDLEHLRDPQAATDTNWSQFLRAEFPGGVEYVFGSEPVCARIADVLGARYLVLDGDRELVAARGEDIRSDPLGNWEFLPGCVRPYYVKRVCLYGPHSANRSALAEQLAIHYDTVAAYEYARRNFNGEPQDLDADMLVALAQAQVASEAALARQANRVLICDSDPLTMQVWSKLLVGEVAGSLRDLAERQSYDLHLLLDVDVPWLDPELGFLSQSGGARALNDHSDEAFNAFREALILSERRYLRLSGEHDFRFRTACDAIDNLLRETPVATETAES